MLTAKTIDEMFGPRCPDCGWRRGQHRPAGQWLTPCPRLTEAEQQTAGQTPGQE